PVPGSRAAGDAERCAAGSPGPRDSGFHAGAGIVMRVDRGRIPSPGPARPFLFPAIEKSTLPSGLRVWSVQHLSIPIVTIMLLLRRGAADVPAGKEGLAAITVDMMD